MLGRHVRVTERFRLFIGAVQDAGQLPRQRRLNTTGLLGEPLDLALRLGLELGDVPSGLLQQGHDNPLVLLQQGIEKVRVVDDGVAAGARQRSGLLKGFSGLYG